MRAKANGKAHSAYGLLLSLSVVLMATQAFSQDKLEYSAMGTWLEGCTCSVPCTCAMSGLKHGCQGVGAIALTSGTYNGVDLGGAKVAFGGLAGNRIYVYVDASESQREAATAFAKAIFSPLGKIEAAKNASIDLSGKGGKYTLTVDGGKIMQLTTEPVMGLDKKTPVVHSNVLVRWSPTVMQGKTLKGSFHDGDLSFTLESSNSYFNDHMKSNGKL